MLLASRRAPGAGLKASWAQMAPILGPFWGHFLGPFLGPSLEHVFLIDFEMIWGFISGSFFESFGAEETIAHQMAQHAKCIKNHTVFNSF